MRFPIVLRLGILMLIGGLFALTWYQRQQAPSPPPEEHEPVVKLAPPSAATPEGVQAALVSHNAELRNCYAASPALDGKLKVAFRLVATGNGARVEAARVLGSAPEHADVDACIIGVIQALHLSDPADGRIDVTYPIEAASK